MTSLDDWWDELASAALVGTARRPPPETPPELTTALGYSDQAAGGRTREEALLDAVVLGSVLRRAGHAGDSGGPGVSGDSAGSGDAQRSAVPETAPADLLTDPPAEARQLLALLLTQSPVGGRLTPLALRHWLVTALAHDRHVPHDCVTGVLHAATTRRDLRPEAARAVDERGRWLAAQHPAWSWARTAAADEQDAPTGGTDHDNWVRTPSAQRAVLLRGLRERDPDAGRRLLESTWTSDRAAVRAELLGALEVGLGEADEAFLELALDDRGAGVREVAQRLLDGLPGSRRAARLGALLGPLLHTTGRLRRVLDVDLPDPDALPATAGRDGLSGAPRGRSRRGWLLERIAAGAPLDTWTATGLGPDQVVRQLRTTEQTDALTGLRRAVLAQRDAAWARALLDGGWDPAAAAVLPPAERLPGVLARVRQVTTVGDLAAAAVLLPGPWDRATSDLVLDRLRRIPQAPHTLPELVDVLAPRLHPGAVGSVRALAPSSTPNHPLHQLAQLLTLVPAITEAFA